MSTKRKNEEVEDSNNKEMKLEESKENDEEVDKPESPKPSDNGEGSRDGFGTGVDQADKNKLKVKGSEHNGTLLICGSTNWDLIGRRELPKNCKATSGRNLWVPHKFGPLSGVKIRFVATGNTCAHNVAVTEDGRLLSWGRNEKGQLGHGDAIRRDTPEEIVALKDEVIVNAACGRNHTLLLTDQGVVYGCGDNKMGQCGVGNQHPVITTPTQLAYKGPPIVKVDCGGEFGMILDCKGSLYSFGCPEYGQLGHNTDGKYFATSNKLAFACITSPKRILFFVEKGRDGHVVPVEGVEVTDVACGTNHTVIVDAQKRVFSWGFGGYGRLGHAEPKDEMIPRLIKVFDAQSRGVRSVYAGNSYSMALTELGTLYLWGQTKRTGEANMYPKPVQDLAGWQIRSLGCSHTSIVVAADESVIAWGPSPTYGEMGFGEIRKSSTTPIEVKSLEGVHVLQVACGMGHSLMIAREESEQESIRIQKLPVYNV
ncbi:protein RCC2 homolog [Hetaerina americana]|uniref:protein RCC2 homolog n=1 Tax=Hetaerina americana TaxID=62018 RepID=UPI003A7F2F6E